MSSGIHPQIFSLLKLKDEILTHLGFRDYESALNKMYFMYMELEKKDHDDTIFEKLRKERITIRRFAHPGGAITRMNTMSRVYESWFDSMMVTLNTKGYFTNAKYGHYDPSNGRKSE
jgi:hypothetical protein